MSTKLYNPQGELVWESQYGSQELLLTCTIKEVLIEGNRGSAKSDTALVDYLTGIGKGWGIAYTGIIFRNEYKELADIIKKAKKLINKVFPDAKFLKSASELKWVFATGEELLFRHGKTDADAETWQGQEIPWMFFDELTNFPNLDFYTKLKACCRSSVKGIKKRILSATNPHGQAHALVKKRFIDPAPANKVIYETINNVRTERVRIHASFTENKHIFLNDPDYIKELLTIVDPVIYQAWVKGNWDIPSGGIFQHIWFRDKHVIDLNKVIIPSHWKKTRSMDWGSAKPFSICWWATSPGESIKWHDGTRYLPRGTKILLSNWYGCEPNKPNTGLRLTNAKIADGIKKHEKEMNYKNVKAGAADAAMWDDANGQEKGKHMYSTLYTKGIKFNKSKKGAGSRVNGAVLFAEMLSASLDEHMEMKGLFISDKNCKYVIEQIPDLPRDDKNSEDVDSDCEDHIYDSMRYELYNDEHESGMFSH